MAIRGPEYWASERPDRVAVVDGGHTLTWAQWDDRANRLAEALSQRGVGAGTRVGVALSNRLEWLVLNAALAKLSAVHVAMNARATGPEMAYLAGDSAAGAVVLDADAPEPAVEGLRSAGAELVAVLADPVPRGCVGLDALCAEGVPVPRVADAFASLAVYTSGTTGRPKGALRTPSTADPRVAAEYRESTARGDLHGDDYRALINMPLHHASGPKQVQNAVTAGGLTVLQRRFDAEEALALIERHRITAWRAVPTMVRRVLDLPRAVARRYDVSSLRELSVGGSAIPYEVKQQAMDLFGEDIIYEGYGCTEASMITRIGPGEHRRKPDSVGRPYPHVSVRVVDDDDRALPPGAPGHILAWTPLMISGYLGHGPLGPAELSADGHFRTGDLGYLDEDGYLYITGRAKDMIISGGANVYPAEVEAVLRRHEAVRDVAVVGVGDDDLGERVVAFVEAPAGADEAELAALCERELAGYKRPRQFAFVAQIPRNSMGKPLKNQLSADSIPR
ncbi:long-chain acyl-CoA synthetase [Lipingzhangella halophila]|uniref:Long-chain acyl-CoA synthetase n=1 Tax=Lipingzhangella halophila TaxID=1783352 RepID=A0A7W7W5Q6_9ACTN|nr:AMP-binding protein [Lipingzhangella halophila]MBB4934963.1 long-chain acyl-CoA synthetase [Lipingzhangella halophila]